MLRLRLPRGAGGFASGFVARAMSHVSTLVLMLYAARHMAPDLFGAYALASLIVAFTMLLLYSGVYEYLLRTNALDTHADAGFTILFVTAVLLTGTQFLLAHKLASAFDSPPLEEMIRIFSVLALIGCASAWREAIFLRQTAHLQRYYGILIVRDLTGLLLGLGLLHFGLGLYALVVARLYISIAGFVMWQLVVPRHPRLDFDRQRLRDVWSYGNGIVGSRGLGFASNYGVDLAIGLLLSPAAVGLYRMSNRIVAAVTDIVGQPMSKLAWVRLSEDARRSENAVAAWQHLQRVMLLIAWAALAFIALTAPELVVMVLGEQWAAAAQITSYLAMAAILRMAMTLIEPLLAVHGKGGVLLWTRVVITVVAIAMALACAHGGIDAIAIGQIGAAVIGLTITVYATARAVPLSRRSLSDSVWAPASALALIVLSGLCIRIVDIRYHPLGAHAVVAMTGALIAGITVSALILVHRQHTVDVK